jgi:hypothetical protein
MAKRMVSEILPAAFVPRGERTAGVSNARGAQHLARPPAHPADASLKRVDRPC